MSDTSHERPTVWTFLRRYFGRIVIGGMFGVVVFVAVSIYGAYTREQRIAKEISALRGRIVFQYAGPDWIPPSERSRVSFLDRIELVELLGEMLESRA